MKETEGDFQWSDKNNNSQVCFVGNEKGRLAMYELDELGHVPRTGVVDAFVHAEYIVGCDPFRQPTK